MANEKEKVVSESKVSETTKVEFLQSCAGIDFSYYSGEIVSIDSKLAKSFIEHEIAKKVK